MNPEKLLIAIESLRTEAERYRESAEATRNAAKYAEGRAYRLGMKMARCYENRADELEYQARKLGAGVGVKSEAVITKAKSAVLRAALGLCALSEADLLRKLEELYWIGFKDGHQHEDAAP